MRRTSRTQKIRIVLGTLLALNLIGAGLVLYPPGGSAEDLEQQLKSLRSQIQQRRDLVDRTRLHASAVEKGRADGDKFLGDYFLARRAAYSAILTEMAEAAQRSHLKERDNSFATEPVDGSSELSMMTITANYEGTYRDLMGFVREMDRSPLLLIVESLNAVPQQGTNTLSVSLKIEAFVREEGQSGKTGLVARAEDAQ